MIDINEVLRIETDTARKWRLVGPWEKGIAPIKIVEEFVDLRRRPDGVWEMPE